MADLINDISLLTKIEEASSLYQVEMVDVAELIRDISGELELQLRENNISVDLALPEHLSIKGNPVLLYSIFRNLFDNAIRHGGNNLTIRVDQYLEDRDFTIFHFPIPGRVCLTMICPVCLNGFTGLTKVVTERAGVPDLALPL